MNRAKMFRAQAELNLGAFSSVLVSAGQNYVTFSLKMSLTTALTVLGL